MKYRRHRVLGALLTITSLASIIGATPAKADLASQRASLRQELEGIFETLEHNYGPLSLKRETIRLDWAKTKNAYLSRLDQIQDTYDYYMLVADLLNGLNDAHVSVTLPSTFKKTLPLQFSYVEGKTILNYYNSQYTTAMKCPVALGDELVKIDGSAIEKFRASNAIYNKYGNDLTNRAMFARMLSGLSEERGLPLTKGATEDAAQVRMTFKRGAGTPFTCELAYQMSGVPLITRVLNPGASRINGFAGEREAQPLAMATELEKVGLRISEQEAAKLATLDALFAKLNKLVNLRTELPIDTAAAAPKKPAAKAQPKKADPNVGTQVTMGHAAPLFKLPADFAQIKAPKWDIIGLISGTGFYAGTFKHKGKTAGLLRIPSYMPSNILFSLIGVRWYVAQLQAKSDYLIIDQMNNPGGAVAFSDMIVHSLVGKYDDSKHMKFAVKPTQHFMRTYAEIYSMIAQDDSGLFTDQEKKAWSKKAKTEFDAIYAAYKSQSNLSKPVSLKFMTEFVEFMVNKMLNGVPLQDQLSKLIGAPVFKHQTYTKPVYFLINEMDFSGGDATPALLQDYGRVKLVGVRTAGAGGSVEEFKSDVMNSFEFRLTTSLMVRKGGKLVENYGVQPDVAFALKASDYADGFANVLPRLLKTLGL